MPDLRDDDDEPPSPAIVQWAPMVAPGGEVLDVAAGGGRHAHFFADRGHPVVAVDRDVAALRARPHPRITVVEADLENAPWPFAARTFAAVVVTNYLWRPLLPVLFASVAPGGYLFYETFAVGHERYGRPRNPDYLLRSGELVHAMVDATRGSFLVLEYSEGAEGNPVTAVRQRLCTRRPG